MSGAIDARSVLVEDHDAVAFEAWQRGSAYDVRVEADVSPPPVGVLFGRG